ncbi:MAG: discoidin domain-containing protein, partial [Verrucomicrobia bacterium]|nr:discoidin domain-containing protein [Verrucomicrobiota bacterium]
IDDKTFTIQQQGMYDNLALASRGSTIAGSNGDRWNTLIDGSTTGYTGSQKGYGFTYWKNAPGAPGQFVLDVKELCRVNRIRLLLWNGDSRYYRYFIEASADGVNWTMIADRTTGQWKGWQDIRFDPEVVARYFRLTGTYNSVNSGFHVVEWEVYGIPPPSAPGLLISPAQRLHGTGEETGTVTVVATEGYGWTAVKDADWITILSGDSGEGSGSVMYSVSANAGRDTRTGTIAIDDKTFTIQQQGMYDNLALASRGSTITGSNGSRWDTLIDGSITGYTGTQKGYGFTYWKNDPAAPGQFVLDVKELCRVDRIRLLLWNGDSRYYRYFIEASADGVNWTMITDRTAGQWKGWQDIQFSPEIEARYFRLTGTFNSANNGFHVVEWEVYGYPAPPPAPLRVRKAARAASSSPRPVDVVVSSGEEPLTNGWNAVDGDVETAWAGRTGDSGWWMALVYDPPLKVSDVELWLDSSSTTNVLILGSEDAADWFALPTALEPGPVWIRYLWMVFEADVADRTPVVLEVKPIP